MRVITARGVSHSIAVAEGHGALAQAFEHHDVELAALREINGRVEPIGGKARPRADTEGLGELVMSGSRQGPCLPGGPAAYPVVVERAIALSRLLGRQSREEQLVDRRRSMLDGADLGHELRGLEDLLRLQREGVILVADDGDDIIDGALGVLGNVEIELRAAARLSLLIASIASLSASRNAL